MLIAICPLRREEWLEMADFAGVAVGENPLGQDVGLRVVLPQADAGLAQIVVEGEELMEGQFANSFGFAEGVAGGLLVYDKVVAFLLEYLDHLGREGRLVEELEAAIGE